MYIIVSKQTEGNFVINQTGAVLFHAVSKTEGNFPSKHTKGDWTKKLEIKKKIQLKKKTIRFIQFRRSRQRTIFSQPNQGANNKKIKNYKI